MLIRVNIRRARIPNSILNKKSIISVLNTTDPFKDIFHEK